MLRAVVLLVAAFALSSPGGALATAQWPEKLIYQGKTHPLLSLPLESYFTDSTPTCWDQATERPAAFQYSCTANWRGYVGTWKITNSALYLIKLQKGSCEHDAPTIPLSKVFKKADGPVRASWYTGILRLPKGKLLDQISLGFRSNFEKELLIAIRRGRVVAKKLIDIRAAMAERVEDWNSWLRQGKVISAHVEDGFRQTLSKSDLAAGLSKLAPELARCAREGKEQGHAELLINPDGNVKEVRLEGAIRETTIGACVTGVLSKARYPEFFGLPVCTRHEVP